MDEDNFAAGAPDNAAAEADQFMASLNKRAAELQETGLSRWVAFGTAQLEARIASWPKKWGDDLEVLIYGDFDAPNHDLDYPALGITVEAGKRTNTIIKTALCVVSARVKVREKSMSAVLDAVTRLNTFLGIWTIIDWGNRGIGWWCHLTHGTMAGAGGPFTKDGIEEALAGIERLRPEVKRKIREALYWIREPKQMMLESFKNNILRVYAGYWNAFECLVEAVCLLHPQSKMKKQEKLDGISHFIAHRQGKLDVSSLGECYRLFVDPGFPAKASHALRSCCPDRADGYIKECFRAKPDQERLYAVRNAINHGDVDSDSLQEMIRVEDKLRRLKMIVFAMLGCLIPFSYPLDSGPR
ncbi:MAG: hypothetical protein IID34_07995 [Planctomycetes bacterium]|nr:hypothetical protein [Planctomycetota bacterium]